MLPSTAFLPALALTAALAQNQPFALKAKADFDKVDTAPIPELRETQACVQSHAALLAIARPEERYLVHYRKGYCELFGALASDDSSSYQAAARDFIQAVAASRTKATFPAGLRILPEIARLERGRTADSYPDLERELEAALAEPTCGPSPVMELHFCQALVETGRLWLGWLAMRREDLERAARVLEPLAGAPWSTWISGRRALASGRFADASAAFEKALKAWEAAEKASYPDVATLLGPRPDLGAHYYQLGQAQFALDRFEQAVTSFDLAVKSSPQLSQAIFLRAKAKEALGLVQPALADYSLAPQTARSANDTSWPIGDASYRRGLLLYRAKDFTRAESAFATAQGSRLGETSQPDIAAWRAMVAVAAGSCQNADLLESSARAATDSFPKPEAEALIFSCRLTQASTPEQLVALEKSFAGRAGQDQIRRLHDRLADLYADQGVAAEDRKDIPGAIEAYRRAVQWNPRHSKARFNLGAIFLEEKRYPQAEVEYRALVEVDPNDFEAHYWLAESILAQKPPPTRRDEACALLRRSLNIADVEKQAQYKKALASALCGG